MNMMIPAHTTTPAIRFDYDKGYFEIKGESYPEDVVEFYTPIMNSLSEYLNRCEDKTLTFDLMLTYFNSSSTKVFFSFFQLLEKATECNRVIVNWLYHEDDDTALEFGQEFQSETCHVEFHLVTVE